MTGLKIFIRKDGEWKRITDMYTTVNNNWQPIKRGDIEIQNSLIPFFVKHKQYTPPVPQTPVSGELWWAPTYTTSGPIAAISPTTIKGLESGNTLYSDLYAVQDNDIFYTSDGLNTEGHPFVYGTTNTSPDLSGPGSYVSEFDVYITPSPNFTRVVIISNYSGNNGVGIPNEYENESFYGIEGLWPSSPRVARITLGDGSSTIALILKYDETGLQGKIVDLIDGGNITPSTYAITDVSAFDISFTGNIIHVGDQNIPCTHVFDPMWAGFSLIRLEDIYGSVIWDGDSWEPWITLGEVRGYI